MSEPWWEAVPEDDRWWFARAVAIWCLKVGGAFLGICLIAASLTAILFGAYFAWHDLLRHLV